MIRTGNKKLVGIELLRAAVALLNNTRGGLQLSVLCA